MDDWKQVSPEQPAHSFKPGGFHYVALKLEQEGYVGGADLALMIESNPGRPLPEGLADYLARWLRGEVKKKRGVKPRNPAVEDFENFDAYDRYRRALRIFERRAKRRKQAARVRGEILPKAEETPREKALMIAARFVNRERAASGERTITPETLKNRFWQNGFLPKRKTRSQAGCEAKDRPTSHEAPGMEIEPPFA